MDRFPSIMPVYISTMHMLRKIIDRKMKMLNTKTLEYKDFDYEMRNLYSIAKYLVYIRFYMGDLDKETDYVEFFQDSEVNIRIRPTKDGGASGEFRVRGPNGAAVRLLEPDRYRGVLHFVIDAGGATIYVNGRKSARGPKGEIALPVGTHAVRVTHPEYRDFVKFIDVSYGKTTEVTVGMTQYPIIRHDLQGKPINSDRITYIDPPWYRRPLAVGIGATVLLVATAIIVGNIVHTFPGGECRRVGGEAC